MKLLFLTVQTTGNASWRQPLDEQPYIYALAWSWMHLDDQGTYISNDPTHTQWIRPKAELHPKIQQILKLTREGLDKKPDFSEVLPQVDELIKNTDFLVSFDWMDVSHHLENAWIRAGKKRNISQQTLSLRILTKERANMRTKRNNRLRSPTLKELHTKLFGSQRIPLYTAEGQLQAQMQIFVALLEQEVIKYDKNLCIFVTNYRTPGVRYRAW